MKHYWKRKEMEKGNRADKKVQKIIKEQKHVIIFLFPMIHIV